MILQTVMQLSGDGGWWIEWEELERIHNFRFFTCGGELIFSKLGWILNFNGVTEWGGEGSILCIDFFFVI